MTPEEMIEKLQLANKKIEEEKEYYRIKAQQDSMCEVYNKRAIEERIREQLIMDQGKQAVLIVDIDELKVINNLYGHLEGDHAIQSIADLLKKYFKAPDLIGRIGGDEFMVYVKSVEDKPAFINRMNDLLKDMRGNFVGKKKNIAVHCSIGVAFTEQSREFDELYRLADAAMYQVKHTTRNGYAVCGK